MARHRAHGLSALLALVATGGMLWACGLVATGVMPLRTDAAVTPTDATTADAADVTVRDAETADARATDANVIDTRAGDARVTDAGATDVRTTDARVTDAHVADARMTDVRVDDGHVTDARVTDALVNDARLNDAGVNDVRVTDARANDARVTDAAREDATARDAARDAPASTTFCATVTPPPTFCADFDEADASPGAGWSSVITDAGVTVTLNTTTSDSPPRSLETTSPAAPNGGTGGVSTVFSGVNSISVDFEVWYTALPNPGDVSPIRLTGPTFPGQDIYFYSHTGGSYFQEYGNDYSPGQAAPSLDAWHHVSIAVTTSGATSTINASFDGLSYWTNHTLMQPWPASATVTLQLGLVLWQVTIPEEIYIDNVVVRVNP